MGEIESKAKAVIERATHKARLLTTAESCTGGGVAASLCAIAGASKVFQQGVVAYANDAKTRLLGVEPRLITSHGAVSREVARAMASGAVASSHADLAISVTGIAGPDGGTADKPVGLVWFGLASAIGSREIEARLTGDRAQIQAAATLFALNLLLESLDAL